MTAFRQPAFLSSKDHPTNRVRCPIHGFIHYSDNERRIIGHRLFQRLRYIRQLALTELVYPGACHTRFEHSLGVMEMATAAFDQLAVKHGARMEAEFRTVDGFSDDPLAMARQVLRVAALLHDTGHAAFSHAAEEAVHKELGHEALSLELITRPDFFSSLLDEMYGKGFAVRVGLLFQDAKQPPQLQLLKQIVAGEMDADRTDYLIRDSHHCGVSYGRFDHRRLIESITLDETSGKLELALHRDGLHAFEALILARYQMNTQVYYHRLRRVYDWYLVNYHSALPAETFDSFEKIVAHNDMTMFFQIMDDAKRDDAPQCKWAKRIIDRRHHRLIFEPGIHVVGGPDLNAAKRVAKAVEEQYVDEDFFFDIPIKPIKIHKLLMPQDEETAGVNLMLISASGEPKPVARASQIFSTIPKAFRPIRIFGDVASKEKRHEIAKFAADRWSAAGGTT